MTFPQKGWRTGQVPILTTIAAKLRSEASEQLHLSIYHARCQEERHIFGLFSEVSKFKSMYKMGTEELHRAFCLRLSRINRDSCKILKVGTLIYYGFRRVS